MEPPGTSIPPVEPDLNCRLQAWRCTAPLDVTTFEPVRRRLLLDGFKWGPQVGDHSTLCQFALVLPAGVWRQLAQLAERLTAEALAAEWELLGRPELLAKLGLPPPVLRVLARQCIAPTAGPRVFRFDFHPTSEGWRISEANSDVPGGYTEASLFPAWMARHFSGLAPAGDPAARLADAVIAAMEKPGCVGLLAAVGYMEDLEVTATLADRLRARGCITHLAHPRQVRGAGDGVLHLDSAWYRGPMNAVLRFFQGEWLGELPMDGAWPLFFRGGRTPVCNPGSGLLVESKRFPLIWERLGTTLPTWRALLPPTRDPRTVNWRRDDRWLLKTAFCNTGDTVTMRGLTADRQRMRAAVDASLRPGRWVAQERFAALVLETPAGARYPCLGVYTVNGTTAGVYGRLAERPLINYTATDVAVLVEATRPVHG